MGKRSSPAVEPTHIKSVKKGTTSSHTAQMVKGRTRLKGVIVCCNNNVSVFDNVYLYNGTSISGPLVLRLQFSVYALYGGTQLIPIPGNGILCDNGIYLSKEYSTTGIVSVAILFQGGAAA